MVLGTMAFGGNADSKAPASYFDLFLEAGGNGSTRPMATPGGEQSVACGGQSWLGVVPALSPEEAGEVPTDCRIPVLGPSPSYKPI
jgi:hypothetical protein